MSTDLDILVKGKVAGGLKREVVDTLHSSYNHFGQKVPARVEVYLVENEETMLEFLKEEKFRLKITTDIERNFATFHDAWRGYPRIMVCVGKLAELGKLARAGTVRHEAAHSVLHGSLEYYIFQISDKCQRLSRIKGIDVSAVEKGLHHVSVAVKDFEATRFLVKQGFIKDQVTWCLETIRPNEENRLAWSQSKTKRQAKYLYETSLLRPVLLTHPLLSLTDVKKISLQQQVDLGRRVETTIEHMEETEQKKLLQVANNIIGGMTEDTHANIDFALSQTLELV